MIMSKLKLILTAFGILAFKISSLQCQVPVLGTEKVLDKLRLNQGIAGKDNIFYDDIQGDPFLFKDFVKGILIVTDGKKFSVIVRYDIYADKIHLKDNGEIFAIIQPEKVKLIEAGDLKFIYSLYVNSPGEVNSKAGSYFILKVEGKCKLLVKKNLRIQDAELPSLYSEAKPAKFVLTDDTYYLKLGENSAAKVTNKKELLALLADKKEEISNYIDSKKLKFKDSEDLAAIISYYNGL
jgi:hypothetical protein